MGNKTMSETDYINGQKAYALKTKEGLYVSYDPTERGSDAYTLVTQITDLRFWDIFTEGFAKRARYIQDYALEGWKVTKLTCEEKEQAGQVAGWVCFSCTGCEGKEVDHAKS
jgi:hypothetical protein